MESQEGLIMSDHDDPDPSPHGVACELCGDSATCAKPIQGFDHPMPLCDRCDDTQVAECADSDCGAWFLADQGVRIYSTSSLYCPQCAREHDRVMEGLERESRRDMDRDDHFDQVRR